MPRYARLTAIHIYSETHSLSGAVREGGARIPRFPRWVPHPYGRVTTFKLQGRVGASGHSSSSFLNCGPSVARLERLLAFLPQDGVFEVEFRYEARGRKGRRRYPLRHFAQLFRREAGELEWVEPD